MRTRRNSKSRKRAARAAAEAAQVCTYFKTVGFRYPPVRTEGFDSVSLKRANASPRPILAVTGGMKDGKKGRRLWFLALPWRARGGRSEAKYTVQKHHQKLDLPLGL